MTVSVKIDGIRHQNLLMMLFIAMHEIHSQIFTTCIRMYLSTEHVPGMIYDHIHDHIIPGTCSVDKYILIQAVKIWLCKRHFLIIIMQL